MTPLTPPLILTFKLPKNQGKFNYFPRRGRGGGGGYPFAENSAKIINLIFEPFPYHKDHFYPTKVVFMKKRKYFWRGVFPPTFLEEKNISDFYMASLWAKILRYKTLVWIFTLYIKSILNIAVEIQLIIVSPPHEVQFVLKMCIRVKL